MRNVSNWLRTYPCPWYQADQGSFGRLALAGNFSAVAALGWRWLILRAVVRRGWGGFFPGVSKARESEAGSRVAEDGWAWTCGVFERGESCWTFVVWFSRTGLSARANCDNPYASRFTIARRACRWLSEATFRTSALRGWRWGTASTRLAESFVASGRVPFPHCV